MVAVALLCVWPMIIEATKRSGKDDTPALFPWVSRVAVEEPEPAKERWNGEEVAGGVVEWRAQGGWLLAGIYSLLPPSLVCCA